MAHKMVRIALDGLPAHNLIKGFRYSSRMYVFFIIDKMAVHCLFLASILCLAVMQVKLFHMRF